MCKSLNKVNLTHIVFPKCNACLENPDVTNITKCTALMRSDGLDSVWNVNEFKNEGVRYPCSLGWLSPTTLAAFFLIYVAPCEFSSSSTSTLKDMVSGEGRCLLRLNKTKRSGKHKNIVQEHTAFESFSKAKFIYSQQPGVKYNETFLLRFERCYCTKPPCLRIRFGPVLIHERVCRDELGQRVDVILVLFPQLLQITGGLFLTAVFQLVVGRLPHQREVDRRPRLRAGRVKYNYAVLS